MKISKSIFILLLSTCCNIPSLLFAYTNETESNGSFVTANALAFPHAVGYGNIFPAADNDYWITSGAANNLIFAYADSSLSIGDDDSQLFIYDDNNAEIENDDDDGGAGSGTAAVVAGAIAPVAGNIYARVIDFYNDRLIQPYYLFLSIIDPAAMVSETEANNTAATANSIMPEIGVNAAVAGADIDFFSFTAHAGDRVCVICDNDPDNDANFVQTNIQILDRNGTTVLATGANKNVHANVAGQITIGTNGTYFVRVARGGGGTDTAYRFVVTGEIVPYNTPTITPTSTETVTFTETPTITWTPTSTETFTQSPTATTTGSFTMTPTITPSNTHTDTVTITATITPTPSITQTSTESATPTSTLTRTMTATITPTVTMTATVSNTPTVTPTPTRTPTFTQSATRTRTMTITPTATQSITDTPSLTVTATPSQTSTLTITPSFTLTATPTLTATVTATASLTFTVTVTYTESPTSSVTPTYTQSPTLTRTPLPTLTLTVSPTGTKTSTATERRASTDLSQVVVYPNPYRENRSSRHQIVFLNLPERVLIHCYSLDGQLVKIFEKDDNNNQIAWDLNNQAGSRIASGVYLYILKTASQTVKGKMVILR